MEINLSESFFALFDGNKRIYWLYIVSSLLIASIYLYFHKKEQKINLSKKLWFHKSAILDYKYFIVSFFIKTVLIVPLVLSINEVSIFVYEFLLEYFGYMKITYFSYAQVMSLFTISLFVISDFTRYWIHRFLHTIPILWEFHKVHHSAKVLTPLTFYRVHPIENLLFGFRYALSIGVVTGVFIYLFGAMISIYEILGVNILLFIFSLAGSNLRHSHIKIYYPQMIERFFMSPYAHQLHHSTKYTHKNFGGYLSIWDTLFKTLQTSHESISKKEKIHFGVFNAEFQSISQLLFTPFKNIFTQKKAKNMQNKITMSLLLGMSIFIYTGCNSLQTTHEITQEQKQEEIALGQKLFFDPILSKNKNQSCATCHNPEHAFSDDRDNGVRGAGSLGDDLKSIGDRNAPTATYAMYSPKFHFDEEKGEYIGGQFYDGREHDLKGQAGGPPLNLVEMGMPSKDFLIQRLKNDEAYNADFKRLYGEDVFEDSKKAYEMMPQAIASFEGTEEFAPFDSKYDRYLRGEYDLSALEDLGRTLFFSNNNTNCSSCHMLKTEDALKETFTNYQYHNIGVPQNRELMEKNVVDLKTFIDHGLLNNPEVTDLKHDGKIKVPTLRNIAVTAPYMHNGVFQKLSTVVEFYDKYVNQKRTINPETGKEWKKAEVAVGKEDLKLLKEAKALSDRKVEALVAFMNLLTDKRYEHLIKEDN